MLVLGHQGSDFQSLSCDRMQTLSQANAKSNCLNSCVGYYFTAQMGMFLSHEEVNGYEEVDGNDY